MSLEKLDELKKTLADARSDSGHHDWQTMQAERAEYLLWELADDLIAVAEAAQHMMPAFPFEEEEHGFPFNFELRAAHREMRLALAEFPASHDPELPNHLTAGGGMTDSGD